LEKVLDLGSDMGASTPSQACPDIVRVFHEHYPQKPGPRFGGRIMSYE
jgi:hypothetical protein